MLAIRASRRNFARMTGNQEVIPVQKSRSRKFDDSARIGPVILWLRLPRTPFLDRGA